MKKSLFHLSLLSLSLAAAGPAVFFLPSVQVQAEGTGCVKASSLPTNITLKDNTDAEIKSYYSALNSLSAEERTGENLLKNLKPILFNMSYYGYDDVWKIYEITDREWSLSPASEDVYGNYSASTNSYTGYAYSSSNSSTKNNPYVHTLYRNRDANGVTVEAGRIREWGDHTQTGGTNREHVWCQSRGFKASSGAEGPAGTDVHHLMSGDGYVNGKPHNNNPYGYVDPNNITIDAANSYAYCAGNVAGKPLHASSSDQSSVVFEPQDSDKGDIARACFYMVARYNNLSGTDTITQYEPNLCLQDFATSAGASEDSSATHAVGMGILSDLLEWNRIDPVDEYEIHRNNLIFNNYQHNRNPFVDYPEWADLIWGEAKEKCYAQPNADKINAKTWNKTSPTDGKITPDSSSESSSSEATSSNSEAPASSESSSSSVAPSIESIVIAPASVSLKVGDTQTLEAKLTPAVTASLTWTSSDASIASVDNNGKVTALKAGKATITASVGEIKGTCEVEVTASPSIIDIVLGLPMPVLIAGGVGIVVVLVLLIVIFAKLSKKNKKKVTKAIKKAAKNAKKNNK